MQDLLSTVYDLQKHAEGKHAVLVGFNVAVVGLVANQLSKEPWSWTIYNCYFLWTIGFLLASIICSFISYLPILNADPLHTKERLQERNPFFFIDAAQMEPQEFLLTVKDGGKVKEEYWLANQIIVNSQIAARKYRLFGKAVWIAFCGQLPPIALTVWIVRWIVKRRKRQ
jgi:hypothetical protein